MKCDNMGCANESTVTVTMTDAESVILTAEHYCSECLAMEYPALYEDAGSLPDAKPHVDS